jgi:glycosyltransferase involved in cell wall biosynthesis
MRALLIDRLPNLVTATKADPPRALNGVMVNDSRFVQALLKYGTYDTYYYIRESAENHKISQYAHPERLKALDLRTLELLSVKAPDSLVLFTSSHHIAKFVPFRQFCGRPQWPICGLTHGLSSNTLIPSYTWNYFAALQHNDAIICTTTSGQTALRSVFENLGSNEAITGVRGSPFPVQTPIIPLGIDIEDEATTSRAESAGGSSGFVVLSIGRLSASYKADLRPAIAAFLRAENLPDGSTLILAGDDTQSHCAQSLQEFADGFASARKVVVMPDISASMKSSLFKMADVALCLTDTYEETFGLSVLEAMAAGLPVVAPSWDGYRDLVLHESTGFLVSTHVWTDTSYLNAVSMLIDPAFALSQRVVVDAEEIIRCLSLLGKDKASRREMGVRAKQRARALFSWQTVIQQYECLWDKLVAEGQNVPARDFSGRLGYMDYARVFHSYPHSHMDVESKIAIPERWRDQSAAGRGLVQFSPPPIAGFSEELDRRILEVCRGCEQLAVRDLLDRIPRTLAGPSMAITQVGRLLKYGLLTVVAPHGDIKEESNEVSHVSTFCPVGV